MNKSVVKKILFFILGFFLLYALLGFWVLPKVLSSQIPLLAKEKLNRDLQFDELSFNPFSLELEIKGFKVKKIGVNSFFNFQRTYINVAVLQSIKNLTLTIDNIQLEKPNIFVIRDNEGTFNFSDLLILLAADNENQQPESSGNFPVTIIKMAIVDGKLSWRDDFYSHAQKEDVYPINLQIENFTTAPNKQSHLEISMSNLSGGELEWKGSVELFPFKSEGYIKLDKVGFHRIWELFLQDDAKFNLLNGTETFEANYTLSDTASGMQLLLNNAQLGIHNFQLTALNDDQPLMAIPSFSISGVAVNLLKKDIVITEISAKDAYFKAWLNAEGVINYQALFASEVEKEPAIQQASTEVEKPWNVSVKKVALNNFTLELSDQRLQKAVHLNLTAVDFKLSDVSTNLSSQIPFELQLTVNKSGYLKLQGQTTPEPFSTNVKIDARDVAINDFQPYIDQFVRLNIISGMLNMNFDVALNQSEKDSMAITFQGDGDITDFVSRKKVAKKDFARWKKLSLKNMNMDLAAGKYEIDTVILEKPYSRISIRKDGSLNVANLVIQTQKKQDKEVEKDQAVKQSKIEPSFKINQFELIDGESDFSDLSMVLPFTTHINQLNGSIRDISSHKNSEIHIALAGRAHDLSPVDIKGKISPQLGNSEFRLDFKHMPLPLMTPYMAEFAGREIEKGNMSLSLNYEIKNDQLIASNHLLIDQLSLGEEIDSPYAMDLPLDLAIALLEDNEGKISIEMPLEGNLNDPQFSVAGIIVDTFVNMITKVVTSPFRAIASLIGDDEDLSQITFSSGKMVLNDAQKTKLDDLAEALILRDQLILEIKGAAYTEFDWPELQVEALDKQILKIHTKQLNIKNDNKQPASEVVVSDDQYKDLLADLFIQKFPQLADRSIIGTPYLLEAKQGGAQKDDFYIVAKEKLSVIIPPNPQRLRQLASARAKAIAQYLDEKNISLGRVYLLKVDVDPEQDDNEIITKLSLTVD